MTTIKVLGPGCGNCAKTAERLEQIAGELGIDARIEKETDLATIMQFGVLSTPGVVIDGKLVHSGGIPGDALIRDWLGALESERR